jgi:putative exporter of polyketide antibiotics
MAIVFAILGVLLAAFAVWLAVRIVNRREKWAIWTAVASGMVLVVYPLSYGPAVLLSRRGLMPKAVEDLLAWIYLPLAAVAPVTPEPMKGWFELYVSVWR